MPATLDKTPGTDTRHVSMSKDFKFINPGKLVDGDLELVVVKKHPANPAKKHVPAYDFEMRKVGKGSRIGSISLRLGRTRYLVKCAGHLGYNVYKRYRGHRYAARGCRLLAPLARAHGLKTMWITCEPRNIASRKTCRLAGGRYVETVRIPKGTEMYDRGMRFVRRYRISLTKR